MFETEMYVWYGTNEYNYEVLQDPPPFKPTRCAQCAQVIVLAEDGYAVTRQGKLCENCYDTPIPEFAE